MERQHDHVPVKVMFVDDEENILRSVRRLLADEDFEVLAVTRGEEALSLLKGERDIGVIVSDQRMPGMTGVEFLEQAVALAPDAVRMLLTGYADLNAIVEAINRGGVQRYIAKPWDDRELLLVVRGAVEHYRLLKENERLRLLTERQAEELRKWSEELEIDVQQQTVDLSHKIQELADANQKLSQHVEAIISALSSLIELRDPVVLNHSNNVTLVANWMAARMGLDDATRKAIAIAAQLHDLGKIGVPDVVLMKLPEEMSPDELAAYRMHPVRGQVAISFIEDLHEEGLYIRHHHERPDGSGFPDGLRGDAIPVGSRIIALADAFDRSAAGTDPAEGVEPLLRHMEQGAGSRFDVTAFHALRHVVRERSDFVTARVKAEEVELSVRDLKPGLIVSRDVRSGTGLLLLGRGATLDRQSIDLMHRCFLLDPAKTGVFVRRTAI